MSSLHDLLAGISCPENEAVWHLLVDLEHRSSFQFQTGRWLADLAPAKLTREEHSAVAEARRKLTTRLLLEATLPAAANLKNGQASRGLTAEEARAVAHYRRELGQLLGLKPNYTTAAEVAQAYKERVANAVPAMPTSQSELPDLFA